MDLTYPIIIITAIIGLLGIKPKPKNKRYPKSLYKRLTWQSYLIAILFVGGAGLGIWKGKNDKASVEKNRKSDSIANEKIYAGYKKQLSDLGFMIRNGKIVPVIVKNTTTTIKSSEKPETPILDLMPNSTITNVDKGTFNILIQIRSVNNYVAKDIKDALLTLHLDKGNLKYISSTHARALSDNQIMEKDKSLTVTYPYEFVGDYKKMDTCFLFLKVNFKNMANVEQSPLRGVFIVTPDTFQNKVVQEANDEQYNKVRRYLIENKLWQ